MPLTRATITRASRIMLPAYVGLFTLIGLNYTVTPRARLLFSPGLAYAESLMSLQAWGAMFLLAAIVLATSLATRRRTLYRFGLWLGIVTMSIWAGVLALAGMTALASPAAWCWPAFVAVACYATNQSLLTQEV